MFYVNLVTFAFCKLFFCHDSRENVASIDAFQVVAEQRMFNHNIQNLPTLRITS